jgi:hypothetical protein
LASLAIPFLLGLAIKGSFTGALLTLVWGGLLRIFLLHHATFAINSICHFFGRRRFATDDESTNVGWLSLLTFGESWHNTTAPSRPRPSTASGGGNSLPPEACSSAAWSNSGLPGTSCAPAPTAN